MRQPVVTFGAWFVLTLMGAASHAQSSDWPTVNRDGPMPVAAFHAAAPSEPAEFTVRAARSRRFSLTQGYPITEDDRGWVYSFDPRVRSEKDLVEEADSIVEGSVLAAAAYISENRHVVYSEFRVRADSALKDRALSRDQVPFMTGAVLVVLREGGAVQLPDQRVVMQRWNSQRLPLVGQRYMLFLRREPAIEAFTLITAYEIKESEVTSLDEVYYFPLLHEVPLESFRQRIRDLVGLVGR